MKRVHLSSVGRLVTGVRMWVSTSLRPVTVSVWPQRLLPSCQVRAQPISLLPYCVHFFTMRSCTIDRCLYTDYVHPACQHSRHCPTQRFAILPTRYCLQAALSHGSTAHQFANAALVASTVPFEHALSMTSPASF